MSGIRGMHKIRNCIWSDTYLRNDLSQPDYNKWREPRSDKKINRKLLCKWGFKLPLMISGRWCRWWFYYDIWTVREYYIVYSKKLMASYINIGQTINGVFTVEWDVSVGAYSDKLYFTLDNDFFTHIDDAVFSAITAMRKAIPNIPVFTNRLTGQKDIVEPQREFISSALNNIEQGLSFFSGSYQLEMNLDYEN